MADPNEIAGTVVTTVAAVQGIASILCNLPFIRPYTILGKVLHVLALHLNVGSIGGAKGTAQQGPPAA